MEENNQSMCDDKQSVIRRRRKKLSLADRSEIFGGTCTSKIKFLGYSLNDISVNNISNLKCTQVEKPEDYNLTEQE